MNRREFLAFSTLAPLLQAGGGREPQQPIEWWIYELEPGAKRQRFLNFVAKALVPALNRLGIQPVGVFRSLYGEPSLRLRLLLPHPNLESVLTVTDRLMEDRRFLEDGAEVLGASMSDPAFVRLHRELLLGFRDFPRVVVPSRAGGNKRRIFELRIYESHSFRAGKKKVEMFNEGQEIPIFFKTGFEPVFFAEAIVGPNLPNLQYMVVFEDLKQRDEAWQRFIRHPDWQKLSADPQYRDTVSNITDLILLPGPGSQL